jgi:hypothetical protein
MDSGRKYLVQPPIINCPVPVARISPKPAKGRRGANVFTRVKTTRQLTIEDCQVGFPIRTSRDQRVLSPPPGLSQSATSFIASCCQGIHQTPFSRLIRSGRRQALLCGSGSTANLSLAFRPEVLTHGRPLDRDATRTRSERPSGQADLAVSVYRLGKTAFSVPPPRCPGPRGPDT